MPRKSIPSTTLVQAVRRYFGLGQQELAAYLGVTRAQVAHIESGRRALSSALLLRLNPLALHLPADAPAPSAPAQALPHTAPPPAPAELEWRRYQCQHRAARLRRELAALLQSATHAARWAAAQPEARPHAATLTPADVARYHLLRLQAEALETEAAALAALLENAPTRGEGSGGNGAASHPQSPL